MNQEANEKQEKNEFIAVEDQGVLYLERDEYYVANFGTANPDNWNTAMEICDRLNGNPIGSGELLVEPYYNITNKGVVYLTYHKLVDEGIEPTISNVFSAVMDKNPDINLGNREYMDIWEELEEVDFDVNKMEAEND